MSADKSSAATGMAESESDFFSRTGIGVEEWRIGFQNVKEILDAYEKDGNRIAQKVQKKHGVLPEGHLFYWQEAAKRELYVLKKRRWWAIGVAAVGSIFIDVCTDQVSSHVLSLPGAVLEYLQTFLSSPAECLMQLWNQLVNALQSLVSLDFPDLVTGAACYLATSAACTIIAVFVGYQIVKLLRRIGVLKPETSLDLDEAFVDKEGKAQRRGLERIQNTNEQER